MKVLTVDRLDDFFAGIAATHQVLLPVRLADGTRSLGSPGQGPVALFGGPLPMKPTAAFFPQHEEIFTATGSGVSQPVPLDRPLFVAGFTDRDLDSLRFIDRFFATGWRDDVYFRNREGAVVAGVAGYCGEGGAFLPLAGGNCDLEMVWDGARWLVVCYSDAGRTLVEGLPDAADELLDPLKAQVSLSSIEHDLLIRRASALVRADRVTDSFWADIGDRCIACTACNLTCPTCNCFGVQDWRYPDVVERSRMWDSCQLDGFMRESSGHNPLGTEALRTRRRIHHKLAADPERWGEISCLRCGRCDAVCPTGIGIYAVSREMLASFGDDMPEKKPGEGGGDP